MSVDSTTVRRIARLARIKVADDEIERLKEELSAMLAFVEQLSEVDVSGVEPMTSVTPTTLRQRADEVFVAYFNKTGGKFWRPAQKVAPNSWAIDIRPVTPVEVTIRPFVCDAPDETPKTS
jgi:aspartyl-tRNA(Asn)/glutamyl-tRNA(Gln) amidotransferase subunit C